MNEDHYLTQQHIIQDLAKEKVVELYTHQFLSHTCEPTDYFKTHNLEDKVVQLDDIGKGYEAVILRLGWRAMDIATNGDKKYARVAEMQKKAKKK